MRTKTQFQTPLILTLSRGEREQHVFVCWKFSTLGFATRLSRILPLPPGEVRGEGNLLSDFEFRISVFEASPASTYSLS